MNGKLVYRNIGQVRPCVFLDALLAPSIQALGYQFLLKLLSWDLPVLASPLFDTATSHLFMARRSITR